MCISNAPVIDSIMERKDDYAIFKGSEYIPH